MTVVGEAGERRMTTARAMSAMDATRAYEAARATLPGANLQWMSGLRARALERFGADGMPGTDVEEWRYTNLKGLGTVPFASSGAAAASVLPELARLGDAPCHRIVLSNGRYTPELSSIGALPDGVRVSTLARMLEERPDLVKAYLEDPADLVEERLSGINDTRPFSLVALNTALMTDGAVIRVDRGVVVDRPIHIIHLSGAEDFAGMIQTRSLVVAAENAEVDVVETFLPLPAERGNDNGTWTNSVVEVAVAADATVRHAKLQCDDGDAVHLAVTRVRVEKDGRYRNLTLTIGGRVARNEIRVALVGRGAACRLDGVFLARDAQSMDHLTRVDHRAPDGASTQVYRGVVDDRARTAFQGKVRVWPGAVRTSANQVNNNLLLSDTARADSKPELEILNDDVACAHGATVGDLDADALFFLRSRGLDEAAARALLVEGFVGELIAGAEHEVVRAHLSRAVRVWLERS